MKEKKIFFQNNEKNVEITCEISSTLIEKTKGLMNREKLHINHGMIFPFLIPFFRVFWMKNVKISLDIIFVNKKLEIINIYEAPVEKNIIPKFYPSKGLCKYVIETNIGFCKKNKIKKGTKIII